MSVLNPRTKVKRSDLFTTEEAIALFGEPGEGGVAESRLVTFKAPYLMRLYERGTPLVVTRIRCHKLVANLVESALITAHQFYGAKRIEALGLDVYGGSYIARKMRGGTEWSKHSFGIAFDFLPQENGLKTKFKDATFGKPEYKEWIDIWQEHGFANLGRNLDYDSMHFEAMRYAFK